MPRGIVNGPFVAAIQAMRHEGLRRLDTDYATLYDPDDVQFADAVAALLVLDVDACCIARRAKVATATVTRWSQGASSPHPLSRPAIVAALRHVIADEIAAIADAGTLRAA